MRTNITCPIRGVLGGLLKGISKCVLYSLGYVTGLWLSVLDKVCCGFGAKGIGEKRTSFGLMGKGLDERWWGKGGVDTGLTHEITIVRGQGRQGAYAEDRSIRVLGVENPSVSLLPRRDEYTRVYTTVYPRVHNSIHACTLPRSKYILSRARLYACFLGIMSRISRDELGLPRIRNDTPKDPKAGVCERDHALALDTEMGGAKIPRAGKRTRNIRSRHLT